MLLSRETESFCCKAFYINLLILMKGYIICNRMSLRVLGIFYCSIEAKKY